MANITLMDMPTVELIHLLVTIYKVSPPSHPIPSHPPSHLLSVDCMKKWAPLEKTIFYMPFNF